MEFLALFGDYKDTIANGETSPSDLVEIKKLIEFEDPIVSEVNIGPGADFITICVSVVAIAEVFKLGDTIDTGIDGWIRLGGRLKRMAEKKHLVAIDKDAASLLAIEFISSLEKLRTLEKTHEHEISWIKLEAMLPDRTAEDFIARPHVFHIQTYLTNNDKYYVVSVTPQGKVELIKRYDAGSPYGMTEV